MQSEVAKELITMYARELKLSMFTRYDKIMEELTNDEGYADFLVKLLKMEAENRMENAKERRIKNAKFPILKTLDEFDARRLEYVSEGKVHELATCNFIKNRQNIVMLGNPGSGKTHLAIALGMKACVMGFKVRFCNASILATELHEALSNGTLSHYEKAIQKNDLLIIDELSYLTFNQTQSELLFRIISERSERASVVITTNLEFSKWTNLFENEMMVAALIDRVTYRSEILNMNCNKSYRMEMTQENLN